MVPLQEKVQCVLWKIKVNDVEHRRLKLHGSKLQLVQHIQPCEKPRVNTVMFMLKLLTAVTIISGKFFSPMRSFYTYMVL
jgi:hypothetical protein